jgi:hypothetical protein
MIQALRNRIEAMEKEVNLLIQQCVLNVTRLVMAEDGVCDWRAFRALLQSKLDRRLGLEAANAVVPAPPVA